MNKKSILMPHSCQKFGWYLLVLSFLVEIAKVLFVHDINVAWYFAKAAHIALVVSLFFICMSKEKVEDEMISGFRLKSIGITAYTFFVFLLVLSIFLDVKPGFIFSSLEDASSAYLSEFFLIVLPLFLFILYYGLFKYMFRRSNKQ
ncbi:MAG: hypothetical protein J6P69_07940 [Bacteroidales bacterium]|nr:hypothetical protein [Bacteroidales bacterium]